MGNQKRNVAYLSWIPVGIAILHFTAFLVMPNMFPLMSEIRASKPYCLHLELKLNGKFNIQSMFFLHYVLLTFFLIWLRILCSCILLIIGNFPWRFLHCTNAFLNVMYPGTFTAQAHFPDDLRYGWEWQTFSVLKYNFKLHCNGCCNHYLNMFGPCNLDCKYSYHWLYCIAHFHYNFEDKISLCIETKYVNNF